MSRCGKFALRRPATLSAPCYSGGWGRVPIGLRAVRLVGLKPTWRESSSVLCSHALSQARMVLANLLHIPLVAGFAWRVCLLWLLYVSLLLGTAFVGWELMRLAFPCAKQSLDK